MSLPEAGLDDLQRSFQSKPCCDSMILFPLNKGECLISQKSFKYHMILLRAPRALEPWFVLRMVLFLRVVTIWGVILQRATAEIIIVASCSRREQGNTTGLPWTLKGERWALTYATHVFVLQKYKSSVIQSITGYNSALADVKGKYFSSVRVGECCLWSSTSLSTVLATGNR